MDRLDRIEAAIEAMQITQDRTDAQLAKTDAKLKETAQILTNVGLNLGIVAEEFFYYTLKESKKFGPYQFDEVDFNVNARNKKVQDEFDIVMYNGDTIAIIEVKHKVHPTDLTKLKTKKVENFRLLFPDYAAYKILLGIGGFSIPAEIAKEARAEGIAVLRQVGDLAEIEDSDLRVY